MGVVKSRKNVFIALIICVMAMAIVLPAKVEAAGPHIKVSIAPSTTSATITFKNCSSKKQKVSFKIGSKNYNTKWMKPNTKYVKKVTGLKRNSTYTVTLKKATTNGKTWYNVSGSFNFRTKK